MMRAASKLLKGLVGARGFEPRTSCAQGRRATRLRYAPTCGKFILLRFRVRFHFNESLHAIFRNRNRALPCQNSNLRTTYSLLSAPAVCIAPQPRRVQFFVYMTISRLRRLFPYWT